jgi:DNA polymerase I-like protein with 3'-5' exonuclease and polymerase domains
MGKFIMTTFPSLQSAKLISIDTETCDPDLLTKGPGYHSNGFIAGISIAVDGFAGYYPIAHEGGDNLDKRKVLGWLKQELKSSIPKLFTNGAYDLGFLKKAGVLVNGPIYDIQIAEPLLDEGRRSYSLETLASDYLGRGKQSEAMNEWITAKFGKRNIGGNIWRAPGKIVAPYAIDDAKLPLRIFAKQRKALVQQGLWDLFLMESSLIPMLVEMRLRGVRVDLDAAEQLYAKMTKRQAKLSKNVGNIPPWNARAIAKLFDTAGIEYPRTPKTDAPSFTKEWLAACSHPVARTMHEIRHLDKLRETFVKGVVLESNYKGRLHCSFNQLRSDASGTVSGRFSSSQPNLQQIPTRTEEGTLIRALFLPEHDQLFGATDFSQIEFRLMTAEAGKQRVKERDNRFRGSRELIDAYNRNPKTDFHSVVAEITKVPRIQAKTITFAIAYGAGPKKIAVQLGLDIKDARKVLEEFHNRAPFIKHLSFVFDDRAQQDGQIKTILGRIRRFPLWETRHGDNKPPTYSRIETDGATRAFTYRALNAYIQGSAADIMKKAMADVWKSGVCDVLGAPHLTVHDELDISVPNTHAGKQAFTEMVNIMQTAVPLSIPLLVDSGLGKNWGEAKE